MSLGSPSIMSFRVKSRYIEKTSSGDLPMGISLPLCHGDMVVMHGTDIHKFYEVSCTALEQLVQANPRRSIRLSQKAFAALP